jgi:hypothetical protein
MLQDSERPPNHQRGTLLHRRCGFARGTCVAVSWPAQSASLSAPRALGRRAATPRRPPSTYTRSPRRRRCYGIGRSLRSSLKSIGRRVSVGVSFGFIMVMETVGFFIVKSVIESPSRLLLPRSAASGTIPGRQDRNRPSSRSTMSAGNGRKGRSAKRAAAVLMVMVVTIMRHRPGLGAAQKAAQKIEFVCGKMLETAMRAAFLRWHSFKGKRLCRPLVTTPPRGPMGRTHIRPVRDRQPRGSCPLFDPFFFRRTGVHLKALCQARLRRR